MRVRLNSAAFFLCCAFIPPVLAEDGLSLQLDNTAVNVPDKGREETPVFISADRMEGKKDSAIEATGNVELRKRGEAIYADHLLFRQEGRDLTAEGRVRIEEGNNVIEGPSLQYNLGTGAGDMAQPVFQFGDNHARGEAAAIHMADKQDYALSNVNYTTCPMGDDDWLLKVRQLDIDRNSQIGVAHSASVEFKGVPILYSPWMDFSLSGGRKSGFLGPTFGHTATGGMDISLPFYWDIAPNMDATLAPRFMAKRGTMLNNEFRYLFPAYSGEAHVDVLPNDRIAGSTRSLASWVHKQNFGYGLNGSVNMSRVSDDAYFRDLSDAVNLTSQTNLLREGILSYSGGWWATSARIQSFQTLQDPLAPVVVPYRRLPQLTLGVLRAVDRATVSLASEYADFRHPQYVGGRRLTVYPSVSYPLIKTPAFYLTPKIGLSGTYYSMGDNNTGALPNATRTLPIFSLDSGLVMERDADYYGHDFVQTLEPRAYYVYIPYRNQSLLPLFDTSLEDFNFTQIFTENRFNGSDRIGDANQVTVALTSRLIEPDSGAERLRVAIGQRFSAISPRVDLSVPATANTAPVSASTPPTVTNKSDVLFGIYGQMTRLWSLDSTFQYNPSLSHTQLFNTALRYQPEAGKVLNLGYRFTRDAIRQVDVSAQWPLTANWHGMARWNYSLLDRQILEALTGLEYNQRCWALRLVAQRFATATQQMSSGLFLQLELNDMVAVGSDPLATLRQNIPGYAKMNNLTGATPK